MEKKGWTSTVTSDEIERAYWHIVETNPEDVHVEYANDLNTETYGSGFPRDTTWKDIFQDPIGKHGRCLSLFLPSLEEQEFQL